MTIQPLTYKIKIQSNGQFSEGEIKKHLSFFKSKSTGSKNEYIIEGSQTNIGVLKLIFRGKGVVYFIENTSLTEEVFDKVLNSAIENTVKLNDSGRDRYFIRSFNDDSLILYDLEVSAKEELEAGNPFRQDSSQMFISKQQDGVELWTDGEFTQSIIDDVVDLFSKQY